MPADPIPITESRKQRVLIADDASGMRTYIRLILETAGYTCVDVADGGEAFDEILSRRYDLLITDLEMPGMDGFQLLAAVSLLPVSRGRPSVIVLSRPCCTKPSPSAGRSSAPPPPCWPSPSSRSTC